MPDQVLEDHAAADRTARRARILELRRAGVQLTEIARQVGLSKSRVAEICNEARIEPDENGPELPPIGVASESGGPVVELTRAQRRALANGGPEAKSLLQQLSLQAAQGTLEAQTVEAQNRGLRAYMEQQSLLGRGGGDNTALMFQIQALQNELREVKAAAAPNPMLDAIRSLAARVDQMEKPTGGASDPAASFARTFRENLALMKEISPAPMPPARSPQEFAAIAEINAQTDLRREALALDREKWEEERSRAMQEWNQKRERNDRIAGSVEKGIEALLQLGGQFYQDWRASKTGVAPTTAATSTLQIACPSCHNPIQFTPGPGSTLWQCPGCGSRLRHPSPVATAFEMLDAAGSPVSELSGVGELSDGSLSSNDIARSVYARAYARATAQPLPRPAAPVARQPGPSASTTFDQQPSGGPPPTGYSIVGQEVLPPGPPAGGYFVNEDLMRPPPAAGTHPQGPGFDQS